MVKKSIHSLGIVTVGSPGSTEEKYLAQSLIVAGFGLLLVEGGRPRTGYISRKKVCTIPTCTLFTTSSGDLNVLRAGDLDSILPVTIGERSPYNTPDILAAIVLELL